jgi:hypothetical protein
MLRKDLTITISPRGLVTVEVHSLADAVELQRVIGESIQMALADGKTGRANGIPSLVNGESQAIRFQVNVSNNEAHVIGFNQEA